MRSCFGTCRVTGETDKIRYPQHREPDACIESVRTKGPNLSVRFYLFPGPLAAPLDSRNCHIEAETIYGVGKLLFGIHRGIG